MREDTIFIYGSKNLKEEHKKKTKLIRYISKWTNWNKNKKWIVKKKKHVKQ